MKILEEIDKIEDFSNLLSIKKIEGDEDRLSYIDFKYDESIFEVQTDWTSSKGEPYTAVISPEIKTKSIELQEKIDIVEIKNLLLIM